MSRHTSKAPSQRQLRVGEEIRHILADVLARGHFRDPELDGLTITVTEVRVSPDLKNATAFVTPLGGGEIKAVVKALKRARGFIRHEMARELTLRYTPELFFEADTSFDEAGRIDEILRHERVQHDLQHDEREEGGDEEDSSS